MSAIQVIPLASIYGTEIRMTQDECIAMLESYGRLVQEAAAKVADWQLGVRDDEYPEHDERVYLDRIAHNIREMPLP